ncbi:FIG00648817: hypothetical protein [hydrothermal vent metagenome]|uniref:DUF4837 domain-containing protein n=1 Tax=hydrothermal vent metagenome TaxID=652676 RepID=A0A3B0RL11_9ZZZZ
MKKIILATFSIMLFVACKEDGAKAKRIVSSSSGNINNLSVVIDNNLWEGNVGETIREIFGAEVYGLPQQEPLFSMSQMPTAIFTGFARKNRTVLKIEKGKEAKVTFLENPFAKPQKLVLITGKTNNDIIEQIKQNAPKIISEFKNEEIKEKQKRISKSLNKNNNIEQKLGLKIKFPSAYRVAKEDSTFFWLRRDIKAGTLNILLYEMPLNAISEGDTAINDIIKMRDSIGKVYIPGPIEGSYMITEEAYTPFFKTTILDNKPTLETRSTWEVKNAFMAGPFLNYIIKDEINNRLLVLEGFAFAPSVAKRDYMFELEAILRSVKIK